MKRHPIRLNSGMRSAVGFVCFPRGMVPRRATCRCNKSIVKGQPEMQFPVHLPTEFRFSQKAEFGGISVEEPDASLRAKLLPRCTYATARPGYGANPCSPHATVWRRCSVVWSSLSSHSRRRLTLALHRLCDSSALGWHQMAGRLALFGGTPVPKASVKRGEAGFPHPIRISTECL